MYTKVLLGLAALAVLLAFSVDAKAAPFTKSGCSGPMTEIVSPNDAVYMCGVSATPVRLQVKGKATCVLDPDTTEDAAVTPTVEVRLLTAGPGDSGVTVNDGQVVSGSPLTGGAPGTGIGLFAAGTYLFTGSGDGADAVVRCQGY